MQKKTNEFLGYCVNVITIVVYFVLLFILEVPSELIWLQYVGLILFAGGIALIILSISALRGEHPEPVISSGIYAVVRHPMYLGAIFLFLAMTCFLSHWIMAALAFINFLIIYRFMVEGEELNLEKFGDLYAVYMELVPRANLLAGFIRLLRRKRNLR